MRPKQASRLTSNPPIIVYSEWTIGICCNGHPGTTPQDIELQPARTGNDELLLEVNESCTRLKEDFISHWVSLDNWAIPYVIPMHSLRYNETQLASTLFETICTFLGTNHLKTAAYHPQMHGQADGLNKTIIARLWYYVAKHHRNLDIYTQLLTYAHNAQVHSSTNLTAFSLFIPTSSWFDDTLQEQLPHCVA